MFKRFFLLVVLFLSPSLAMAGKNDAEWNPPARYDHSFSGKLTMRYLTQKQVVTACAKLFAAHKVGAKSTFTQRGCAAITGKTSCTVIVIDKTFGLAIPKAVLRHEIGHCNGWSASHPD
ncbi:hypothetical protein [Mesorhizobium muleiense]|uniref:Uncharacterized protein n=1 Tax=Mesorhizobium muleiense TaxID=1004279 RepID=A0A1G8J0K6_9HYPH|nr:hypothetical protein [Mesorhizobium muleiense]MCF6099834.1 hypothetical protein [Mesorhizobium muleiense]SDI24507.1 hypothetical protein SAMN05428953_101542 [Mesorhizobium muleiense]